jgi:nucleoid-associated protein YgaU
VPPDTPRVYIAVPGDSLSKIAGRFYGDPNQWRKIYEANKKKIDPNTKWVYPGQKLVVPDETAPAPSTPPTPSPVDPAMPVA